MIEHPVPQNITSYEFRLIGNMTIKQFLLLLVGGVLGFILYSTNLPGIIKMPLALISVLAGIGMAFVPYEERTLDQWFINFIRAIYRPTKYYWRRTPQAPEFFEYQAVQAALDEAQRPDMAPYRQARVREFLSSLGGGSKAAEVDPLDILGKESDVNSLFEQVAAAADVKPGKELIAGKPSLQTRPRPLGSRAEVLFAATPATPVANNAKPRVEPVPVATAQMTAKAAASNQKTEAPAPATVAKSVEVAPVADIQIKKPDEEAPEAPASIATPQATSSPDSYVATQKTEKVAQTDGIIPVVFNKNLPFPSGAEKPNLLIGMVHDANNSIITGAIVEIEDMQGDTVRAMKTNNLGQFYMSSPLPDGEYIIRVEKEGMQFPVYKFTASGQVLDPVDIGATG